MNGFELRYTARTGLLLLAVFVTLLVMALVPSVLGSPLASVAAAFYRAGALVFGGGHVVLPLLQAAVVTPGWVTQNDFLAGYGAAQAVPGPMFSLAAFLGARIQNVGGSGIGALVSLLAILTPGFLLVAGVLPGWRLITQHPGAVRALAGVNAAVVGLLAAALYDPVWTSAVLNPQDLAISLVGFVLLTALRASSLLVVAWCVIATMLRTRRSISVPRTAGRRAGRQTHWPSRALEERCWKPARATGGCPLHCRTIQCAGAGAHASAHATLRTAPCSC